MARPDDSSMRVVSVENCPGSAYECPVTNIVTTPYRPSGETRVRLGIPATGSTWRTRKSGPKILASYPAANLLLRDRHTPLPAAKYTREHCIGAACGLRCSPVSAI